MNYKDIIKYANDALIKAGADKAKVSLSVSSQQELNVAAGEINLFRTTHNISMTLMGLVEGRKGSTTINQIVEKDMDEAAAQVVDLAKSAPTDEANGIAEYQEPASFSTGPVKPDLNLMYNRLSDLVKHAKVAYPQTIIEEINFSFHETKNFLYNSNEVDKDERRGLYSISVMFTSKDGEKTTSFNYVGMGKKDLEIPFTENEALNRLLKQSAEQLNPEQIPEKFMGDVIITPECLPDIIGSFMGYISGYSLITKTSVYQDKLNKKIADERLNLISMPRSEDMAYGYCYTSDGFEAKNTPIIENGVLKNFVLDLYSSNKTGLKRSDTEGGFNVIDPGEKSYEELIRSTKRGILLCRFSGGSPSQNGDFSGVAKNSYYIENGKIKFAISETMVSGNIVEMLNEIEDISKERVNNGYSTMPWIKFNNLTVSGK